METDIENRLDTAGGRRGWEELREVTFYHLLFLYGGEFELKWLSQAYSISCSHCTYSPCSIQVQCHSLSFPGSVMQRPPFCHPLDAFQRYTRNSQHLYDLSDLMVLVISPKSEFIPILGSTVSSPGARQVMRKQQYKCIPVLCLRILKWETNTACKGGAGLGIQVHWTPESPHCVTNWLVASGKAGDNKKVLRRGSVFREHAQELWQLVGL